MNSPYLPPSHWWPSNQLMAGHPTGALRQWLLDQGSLTRALVKLSCNDFQVRVLHQDWRLPRFDERALLGLPPRRVALVREVCLLGHGQPWVYARSILPETSLRRRLRFLRRLDDRPLGALLFRDPDMRRGPQQIGRQPASMVPAALGQPRDGFLWGRRNVYFLYDEPLLVSEVFLPALETLLQQIDAGEARTFTARLARGR